MKLWSGRFGKETDALVNDFNASIQFDQRLYREDITGSMAHAKMLGACGFISMEDVVPFWRACRVFWKMWRPARWNSPPTTRTST